LVIAKKRLEGPAGIVVALYCDIISQSTILPNTFILSMAVLIIGNIVILFVNRDTLTVIGSNEKGVIGFFIIDNSDIQKACKKNFYKLPMKFIYIFALLQV
jgi:hypothetical protein